MRLFFCIAGIGLLASLAAPAFGQIAADPLLPTGTLTLPTGAYSPLPDPAQRVYGFFIGAEGSVKSRPAGSDPKTIKEEVGALAADIARDRVVLSVGYEHIRLSVSDNTAQQPVRSFSVNQEMLFLGISSLVAGTFHLAATFGQVHYNASAEFQNGSGTADMGYPDLTVGFSVNVAPQWRIGANLSPAVGVSSPYDGSLVGAVQKTGHGDQVRMGLSRNSRSDSYGLDGYYYEENLAADTPRTQGWLLHGAHRFGRAVLRAEYDYIDEAKVVDGTRFVSPPTVTNDVSVGLFWGLQTWVVGIRAAQNTQTSSDFGDTNADANRNESITVNVVLLSVLKQF